MMPLLFRRWSAALLSAVYFSVHVLFPRAVESNVWEERRRAVERRTAPSGSQDGGRGLLAALSSPEFRLSSLESRVTASLPAYLTEKNPALKTASLPAPLSSLIASLSRHGDIRDVRLSRSGPVIVHVQDLHGHAQAQENISRMILDALSVRPDAAVALEGASGPFDLAEFRDADPWVNRQVGHFFFKTGIIAGPELAAFLSPAVPRYVGVENEALYLKNVDAVRRALAAQPRALEAVRHHRSDLEKRKAVVFSPELKVFDARVRAREMETLGLGEFAASLAEMSVPGPTVVLFLSLRKAESALDFAAAEKERNVFLQRLAERLPAPALEALVQQGLALRAGALTQADFHTHLTRAAAQAGVPTESFPRFFAYVRYVAQADAVDPQALHRELAGLEAQAWVSLCRTPAQKALVEESRILSLREKLVRLQLTPDEWTDYGKTGEDTLGSFEAFYAAAESRNQAIVDRLPQAPVVLLIAGGFHTEGLTTLLHGKATLLTVAPKLDRVDGASDYLSVFARSRTPLELLFESPKITLVNTPSMSPIGRSGSGDVLKSLASPVREAVREAKEGKIGRAATPDEKAVVEVAGPEGFLPPLASSREEAMKVETEDGLEVRVSTRKESLGGRLGAAVLETFGLNGTLMVVSSIAAYWMASFIPGLDPLARIIMSGFVGVFVFESILPHFVSGLVMWLGHNAIAPAMGRLPVPDRGRSGPADRSSIFEEISSGDAIGPAMRLSGKGLTAAQHKAVNQAIAGYFPAIFEGKKGLLLDPSHNDYKALDPEGLLRARGVRIFYLEDLRARVNEICLSQGIEAPSDLVTHPGRRSRQLYIGREDLPFLLSRGAKWLKAWSAHEAAHMDHPDWDEDRVQAAAQLPPVDPRIPARLNSALSAAAAHAARRSTASLLRKRFILANIKISKQDLRSDIFDANRHGLFPRLSYSPEALEVIRGLREFEPEPTSPSYVHVAVGGVQNLEQALEAARAGADIIVSPKLLSLKFMKSFRQEWPGVLVIVGERSREGMVRAFAHGVDGVELKDVDDNQNISAIPQGLVGGSSKIHDRAMPWILEHGHLDYVVREVVDPKQDIPSLSRKLSEWRVSYRAIDPRHRSMRGAFRMPEVGWIFDDNKFQFRAQWRSRLFERIPEEFFHTYADTHSPADVERVNAILLRMARLDLKNAPEEVEEALDLLEGIIRRGEIVPRPPVLLRIIDAMMRVSGGINARRGPLDRMDALYHGIQHPSWENAVRLMEDNGSSAPSGGAWARRNGINFMKPSAGDDGVSGGEIGRPRASPPAAVRPLILFLDDDAEYRRIVSRMLEDRYRVVVGIDGQEGQEILQRQRELGDPVRAVITDMEMLGMSGAQFTHWLRSEPLYKELPLLQVSGNPPEKVGHRPGLDSFLPKPFTAGHLELAVYNLFYVAPSSWEAAAVPAPLLSDAQKDELAREAHKALSRVLLGLVKEFSAFRRVQEEKEGLLSPAQSRRAEERWGVFMSGLRALASLAAARRDEDILVSMRSAVEFLFLEDPSPMDKLGALEAVEEADPRYAADKATEWLLQLTAALQADEDLDPLEGLLPEDAPEGEDGEAEPFDPLRDPWREGDPSVDLGALDLLSLGEDLRAILVPQRFALLAKAQDPACLPWIREHLAGEDIEEITDAAVMAWDVQSPALIGDLKKFLAGRGKKMETESPDLDDEAFRLWQSMAFQSPYTWAAAALARTDAEGRDSHVALLREWFKESVLLAASSSLHPLMVSEIGLRLLDLGEGAFVRKALQDGGAGSWDVEREAVRTHVNFLESSGHGEEARRMVRRLWERDFGPGLSLNADNSYLIPAIMDLSMSEYGDVLKGMLSALGRGAKNAKDRAVLAAALAQLGHAEGLRILKEMVSLPLSGLKPPQVLENAGQVCLAVVQVSELLSGEEGPADGAPARQFNLLREARAVFASRWTPLLLPVAGAMAWLLFAGEAAPGVKALSLLAAGLAALPLGGVYAVRTLFGGASWNYNRALRWKSGWNFLFHWVINPFAAYAAFIYLFLGPLGVFSARGLFLAWLIGTGIGTVLLVPGYLLKQGKGLVAFRDNDEMTALLRLILSRTPGAEVAFTRDGVVDDKFASTVMRPGAGPLFSFSRWQVQDVVPAEGTRYPRLSRALSFLAQVFNKTQRAMTLPVSLSQEMLRAEGWDDASLYKKPGSPWVVTWAYGRAFALLYLTPLRSLKGDPAPFFLFRAWRRFLSLFSRRLDPRDRIRLEEALRAAAQVPASRDAAARLLEVLAGGVRGRLSEGFDPTAVRKALRQSVVRPAYGGKESGEENSLPTLYLSDGMAEEELSTTLSHMDEFLSAEGPRVVLLRLDPGRDKSEAVAAWMRRLEAARSRLPSLSQLRVVQSAILTYDQVLASVGGAEGRRPALYTATLAGLDPRDILRFQVVLFLRGMKVLPLLGLLGAEMKAAREVQEHA